MNGTRSWQPLLAAVLFTPLVLLSVSCGGPDRLPCYPVSGKVTYHGKPTPGALVVFDYVDKKDRQDPLPTGYVREDGSFSLTTYSPDDGAPEGDYRVAITWIDPKAKPDRKTGEMPNQLPDRFANAQKSGLQAKVGKGTDNRAIFRLSD
jgi:hypothetical protein